MAYKSRTGRIKPECGAFLAVGTRSTLTAWGGGGGPYLAGDLESQVTWCYCSGSVN